MANWCNVRLVAYGPKEAVAGFSEKARSRPSSTFRGDMLVGEARGPGAERMQRLGADSYRKVFLFQVRNDDGLEHFRRVSKRHRNLSFVLVYGDPNVDDYGSYLLKGGTARAYCLVEKQKEAVMRKHRVTEEDDDNWRFWEASWELMDIAEARWTSSIGRPRKALQPTRRARRAASKPKKRVRAARR